MRVAECRIADCVVGYRYLTCPGHRVGLMGLMFDAEITVIGS